jgi:hypothetical protein
VGRAYLPVAGQSGHRAAWGASKSRLEDAALTGMEGCWRGARARGYTPRVAGFLTARSRTELSK